MNKSIELQVIRTIHPVGQGAFYTETLHRPGSNDDKHIVYDCGSLTSYKILEREILDYLPRGSTIDVLFISHFHSDHVNGIGFLSKIYKIKHVVLPQVDDYDWFYIIENYLTNGEANVNLISDVRASIGDAGLVQVAPNGGIEEVVSNNPTRIDEFGGGLIDGLRPLAIGEGDFALWHYIVVNPLVKGDLDELKKAIQEIDFNDTKLTIDDLHNPDILAAVRGDLQIVYSKVFKGGNEYSMCMLSELADRKQYGSCPWFNKGHYHYWDFKRYVYLHDGYPLCGRDGCLYCGDADFLHYNTLDCLKQRLRGREDFVGLLQLPHHGSKENFSIDLLNWLENLLVTFACYGSPNRYKHPSTSVMGAASTFSIAVGVNQYTSNVLTERVDVYEK